MKESVKFTSPVYDKNDNFPLGDSNHEFERFSESLVNFNSA